MMTIAFLFIALLAAPAAAPTDEWSRFRGPNGSGLSDTKGLPTEFGPTINVIWKVELPQGYSSPIVIGDRIFLTGFADDKLVTICLDRKTGKVIWQREAPRDRNGEARPAQSSGGAERGHGRHVGRVLLRRLRAARLRHERQGAVAEAARTVQQHLRHGRFARHRRRPRRAQLRSEHGLVHRRLRQEDRQGTLAYAAPRGAQRALDADRLPAGGRWHADPRRRIVPADSLRRERRRARCGGCEGCRSRSNRCR